MKKFTLIIAVALVLIIPVQSFALTLTEEYGAPDLMIENTKLFGSNQSSIIKLRGTPDQYLDLKNGATGLEYSNVDMCGLTVTVVYSFEYDIMTSIVYYCTDPRDLSTDREVPRTCYLNDCYLCEYDGIGMRGFSDEDLDMYFSAVLGIDIIGQGYCNAAEWTLNDQFNTTVFDANRGEDNDNEMLIAYFPLTNIWKAFDIWEIENGEK